MAEKHLTDGTTALAAQPRVLCYQDRGGGEAGKRAAAGSGLYPRQLGLR